MTGTPVHSSARALQNARPQMTVRHRLHTHLEVARLDLVFHAGLVSVAGAVLSSDNWTFWQLLGAWAAPTCAWFAAMYGGDYFGRELDEITKSQRLFPSGRLRPAEALGGMIAWALLGMVIAALLNPLSFVMVVLALSLGVAYSRFLKARGIWGNICRGLMTACAFSVGALSTDDSPAWALLTVAFVFALHDAASNVTAALYDQDDDRERGCRTFPVRHGEMASLRLIILLHLLWVVLAVGYPLGWATDRFQIAAYLSLLAVAMVMTLGSVLLLTRSTSPVPRVVGLKSLSVLVMERLVLGGAFVAGASGIWLGVAILVPFVVATALSSLVLIRGSYEPVRRRRARGAALNVTV